MTVIVKSLSTNPFKKLWITWWDKKKYMIKVRLYLPFVREEKQETYIDKDEFIATTPGLFMVFCFMAFVFYCAANYVAGILLAFRDKIAATGHFTIEGGMETPKVDSMLQFHPELKTVYMIAALMLLIVSIRMMTLIKENFGKIAKGQKDTSQLTSNRAMFLQYRAVPERTPINEPLKKISGGGGVVVGRYNFPEWQKKWVHILSRGKKDLMDLVFIDDSPVNNLLVAGTRGGKGESWIVPTIDIYSRATEQPSLVLNDPKGELAAMMKETLEMRGFEVLILNMYQRENSMSYNPLQLIIDAYKSGDFDTAANLCNTLTYTLYHNPKSTDPIWEDSSRSLCKAMILAICEKALKEGTPEKITMYTVARMLQDLGQSEGDEPNQLDEYFKSLPDGSPAKDAYATSKFSEGKSRSSIFFSANSKLEIFTDSGTAKLTSQNSLKLEEIAKKVNSDGAEKKPIAIFMVIPDYDPASHIVPSIFVGQLYFTLAKYATSRPSGKLDRLVVFMLDEFGSMPTIDNMAGNMTVCLGRNIRFNLIIQALQQIKAKYGEDESTIIGNCGNQFLISTLDKPTSEYFSQSIGKHTIVIKVKRDKRIDTRELLTPTECRQMEEGDLVLLRSTKRRSLNNRRIRPYPRYNHGDTNRMKYRYEYLSDLYDNSKSINDVKTICTHSEVNPDSLTIKNFTVLQAIREEQRQAENARLKQKSLKREKKSAPIIALDEAILRQNPETVQDEPTVYTTSSALEAIGVILNEKFSDTLVDKVMSYYRTKYSIQPTAAEDILNIIDIWTKEGFIKKPLSKDDERYIVFRIREIVRNVMEEEVVM
ncbi:TPA_asm: TraM recognition domain-containing protein [Listeria monocytogenes]|nr:TraM recognition domain-containing protein [Listeria monocytogenes]